MRDQSRCEETSLERIKSNIHNPILIAILVSIRKSAMMHQINDMMTDKMEGEGAPD